MITCTHTQTIVKCYDLKKKTSRESVSNQIAASGKDYLFFFHFVITFLKFNYVFSVNKEVTQINESVKAVVKFGTLKPKKKDDFKCPVAIFELDDPAKKSMYPKHLVRFAVADFTISMWINFPEISRKFPQMFP